MSQTIILDRCRVF